MRVVLLSSASSIHTIQWVTHLAEAGLDIHIISQHPAAIGIPQHIPVHILPFKGFLGYFLNIFALKKLLKEIKPDILNAHYASGYGTTARLVNFHPYILSVWGSDVYDFPYKSFLHNFIIKKNLMSATSIASTSHCMATQTKKVLPSITQVSITPFGVDTEKFLPRESRNKYITIGTVKTLAEKYGVDLLIHAFSLLRLNLQRANNEIYKLLKLRIVGGGPQESELKKLVEKLNLEPVTEFVGHIDHARVPSELAKLDIYVALSRLDSESFGVAIVEAQAVEIPVVVSSVGGLPEVVKNNITGLVVAKENVLEASIALEKLVLSEELRLKMGKAGRAHVMKEYDWTICTEKMIHIYSNLIKKSEK